MVAPIRIEGGINVGPGISIGAYSGGGGTPGVNNCTGYSEMPPPITPGGTLEDTTATINSPTGFTINDQTKTGIAITALSASNQTWFAANFSTGTHTCTWGPGSTVPSSTIIVITSSGTNLVFFVQGQTGPATYNYPFTFSV
jgi:hypothetical protein